MPKLQAITRERHATQRWQRNARFTFAAQDTAAPLVLQELACAALHLPIALMAVGAVDAGSATTTAAGSSEAPVANGGRAPLPATKFQPVALLGLVRGENLFVSPQGQWTAPYTPAVYRAYPFVVAQAPDGAQVLCVDEDSGLLANNRSGNGGGSGNGGDGEAFFAEDGQPSRALTEVYTFLNHVRANRTVTEAVCALWHAHQLIVPWPLRVHTDQGEVVLQGLFTLDEARLNQLPAAALAALRDGGALAPAYAVLFALQHVPALLQRKRAREAVQAQAAGHAPGTTTAAGAGTLAGTLAGGVAPAAGPGHALVKGKELDLSFLEGSETFKFG